MKQKPQVTPVVVEKPAPPIRLTQEELAQLLADARREYSRYQDYGGSGLGPLLSLLLFNYLDSLQEQNRLLTRIVASLQATPQS